MEFSCTRCKCSIDPIEYMGNYCDKCWIHWIDIYTHMYWPALHNGTRELADKIFYLFKAGEL